MGGGGVGGGGVTRREVKIIKTLPDTTITTNINFDARRGAFPFAPSKTKTPLTPPPPSD